MKKLAMLLTAAMLLLSAAGCGAEDSSSKSAGGSKEDTKASDTVADTDAGSQDAEGHSLTVKEGVLVMGTNATFPPYEYYDGDEIVGIDQEIAAAVAEKLGLELEIKDMDFGSIVTAVQTDKVDIGLAGMTVTEERLENVDFSDSYATGVQVIIVPEDSDIASADDLEGKQIGVQENTTGHIYCSDDYGEDHVTAYTAGANAIEALKIGKVDCVVIDNEPAKAFVAVNEGLKILETEYITEDYAAAVSKDNPELLEAVNGALAELKADGTLQEIIDKYIPAE